MIYGNAFYRQDLSNEFPDHPAGRTEEYTFGLEGGSVVADILNSPRMLEELAGEVIQGCNSVGLVGFGRTNGGDGGDDGDGHAFVVFSNGRIEEMECIEWWEESIPWGQRYCP